jgi:hypothetical protein
MLNKRPVFVNGFQRGGTNILINLLASHPDLAWAGETHEIFYGRELGSAWGKLTSRIMALPVVAATRQHYFWVNRMADRPPLSHRLCRYVDWLLYRRALRAESEKLEELKTNQLPLPRGSIQPVFKNLNGVVLTTPVFHEMYPQASFIGLVRNGLALCEGFLRRGWSAERFGKMYAQVCNQMLEDAKRIPNYRIVRFEEILVAPTEFLSNLQAWANLNDVEILKVRLQAKKSMDKDGVRRYMFGGNSDREVHWVPIEDLANYFRKDVNENQINRLSDEEHAVCLSYIQETMLRLGYL